MAGNTQGSIGFESKLWDAADLLRNNMDPSEYKHVVLGLIFLKYISDSFVARQAELTSWVSDPENEDYYWPDDLQYAFGFVFIRCVPKISNIVVLWIYPS